MKARSILAFGLLALAAAACRKPSSEQRPDASPAPAASSASLPVTVVDIACAGNRSFALHSDGSVKAWGDDGANILLVESDGAVKVPTLMPGLSNVRQIVSAAGQLCVLLREGDVQCWGDNTAGSLGDGTATRRSQPRPVLDLGHAVEINLSDNKALVRLKDGTLRGWGDNSANLVPGVRSELRRPAPLRTITAVTQASMGGSSACAVHADGSLSCWGRVIGTACSPSKPADCTLSDPTPVKGMVDCSLVRVGSHHACAVHQDGTVSCWGRGEDGQLGDGVARPQHARTSPKRISNLADIQDVALGDRFTCALRKGAVLCWGNNESGQLGVGDKHRRHAPTLIPGLSDVTRLAAGDHHACALRSNQTVVCWGSNATGQIGDGTTATTTTPVAARLIDP